MYVRPKVCTVYGGVCGSGLELRLGLGLRLRLRLELELRLGRLFKSQDEIQYDTTQCIKQTKPKPNQNHDWNR